MGKACRARQAGCIREIDGRWDERHPQRPPAWAVPPVGGGAVSLCPKAVSADPCCAPCFGAAYTQLFWLQHPPPLPPIPAPTPLLLPPAQNHIPTISKETNATPSTKKHQLRFLVKRFIKNLQYLPERRMPLRHRHCAAAGIGVSGLVLPQAKQTQVGPSSRMKWSELRAQKGSGTTPARQRTSRGDSPAVFKAYKVLGGRPALRRGEIMRAGRDSEGCRWLVGHLHLCPAGTWHRQVMANALPEAAGRKNAACPCLSPQPQPGDGLQGPQIGPMLLVFTVISQSIPCPRCCSTLWGCLRRCMGRMVPVVAFCLSSIPEAE